MTAEALRVAVLGGGITGLTAAYALGAQASKESGIPVEVTLLEGDNRLGGKVRTEQVGQLLFEQAPDSLFVRNPSILDVLRQIGLEDQLVRADSRHRQSMILRDGRLHPLPDGMEGGVPRSVWPLVTTRLLTPFGKLRAAWEWSVPASTKIEDESVDGFVRRRFGTEVAERIAAPLLGTVATTDTRRLSLLAAFPHLRAAEREHGGLLRAGRARRASSSNGSPSANGNGHQSPFVSLRDGMAALPAAMHARLVHVTVRLGAHVRWVRPGTRRGSSGFELTLGDGERLAADRVIVATPAFAAAEMLQRLSRAAASSLAAIRYGSVVVVALAFEAEAAASLPEGRGFVVAPGERRLLAACSWSSRVWPHCAPSGELVVRCHLHAERRPGLLELDDRSLLDAVRAELRDVLGIRAKPLVERVYRWPRAIPSYEVGHLNRLAAVAEALNEFPGLVLAGAGYRGVGVLECMRQGLEAATRVLSDPAAAAAPA